MENLDNAVLSSIDNYFEVLKSTGYMKDRSVEQLVLLDFLQDFVDNYQEYFQGKDYRVLNNIFNCLVNNSCLMDWNTCGLMLTLESEGD